MEGSWKKASFSNLVKSNKTKIHIKDIDFKESYYIIKDFLCKIFENIKPEYFKVKGVYGFDDPSTTGMTYGIISMLKAFRSFKVDIFPVFTEQIIDIEIETYGKTKIINLIIIFISTIFKKPIRKLIFRKKDKNKFKSKTI